MRKVIIIGVILIVLLFASGKWLYFMLWTDKTVYEVKEGIKTTGYKDKSKEELKPLVRGYVKELFEGHPPILPRWYVKMKSLVKLGKPGIEALIEILKDKEEGKNMVRMAKSKFLEYNMRIATLYVIKQITNLGKDGSKKYKEAYETLMESLREQVPALIEILLHDEDIEIRKEIASLLGNIGDDRAVDSLIKALNDPGVVKEREWIGYSGRYVMVDKYPVRERAASALADIGDSRAVEPMIEALRKYGIGGGALAHIDPVRAVEPLIEVHLKTGREAESLAKTGDRRAVRPMIQRILEEKNEHLRNRQIKYLGKLGGQEAVDFLLQELKENKYDAKQDVIEALGYAKDTRAVEPLFQVMMNSKDYYRYYAALALAEIGDKRAINVLKEELKTAIKGSEAERKIKEALKKLR